MTAKWEDAFDSEDLARLLDILHRENAAPLSADAELSTLTHGDARWLLKHLTELALDFERMRSKAGAEPAPEPSAARGVLVWAGRDDRGRCSARLVFEDPHICGNPHNALAAAGALLMSAVSIEPLRPARPPEPANEQRVRPPPPPAPPPSNRP